MVTCVLLYGYSKIIAYIKHHILNAIFTTQKKYLKLRLFLHVNFFLHFLLLKQNKFEQTFDF